MYGSLPTTGASSTLVYLVIGAIALTTGLVARLRHR